MRITSDGTRMVANLGEFGVVWEKGSHIANVYHGTRSPNAVDVFSFAFEKNETSMLDFTESLQNYLEYREEEYNV